jgi:HD-GYP domain-containing protein (c-di-GMP phosphodiesterase class II)
LLYAGDEALIATAGIAANRDSHGDLQVLVGVGPHAEKKGHLARDVLDEAAMRCIHRALQSHHPVIEQRHFAMRFGTRRSGDHVIYLATETRFVNADTQLVELFCQNVSVALENLSLHDEIVHSQRQLILLLSSAIEERSPELRNHVRRVSEYAVQLGRLYGLSEPDLELLNIGAVMHDLGKIGIPDAVLNKAGPFDPEERKLMQTHVQRGRELLSGQTSEMMQQAQIVVGQHHEQWDGGGYPAGLTGEQIHIFGRIAAIADVFDALTTQRCYKQPWPVPQAIEFIREQRGRQFDPHLVDLFLDNVELFLSIRSRLIPSE